MIDTPPSLIASGAGFGIRFLARLIDLVYGAIIGAVVGFMAGILFAVLAHFGKLSPEWLQLLQRTTIGDFGFGILGAFLYHAVSEGLGTVSIGKLICGLSVVQTDGRPATMKGALIRSISYYWDGLFCGLVGYHSMEKGPLKQRYGDVWGATVVVKKDVFRPTPIRGPGRIFVGIFLGSILSASTVFAGLFLKVL